MILLPAVTETMRLTVAMATTAWMVAVAMMRSTLAQAMTGCKAAPATTP